MRFVCLPSELSAFWSAGVVFGAGVRTAISGLDWVAASDCVAESPLLPDSWVFCSSAVPPGLSGTSVWGQVCVGDRKRNTIAAALRIVGVAYSNWTPEGGKDYFGGYGYVALKLEGKMSFSVQVVAAKGRNP